MQLETLDATVRDYIVEIETSYEQRIKELQIKFDADIKELQFKYLEIKERYDLLIYKKFVRSAEQLLADKSQSLLFTEEGEKTEVAKEKDELTEIKSFKRKKKGRKPLAANIQRRDIIIDIPDSEKTCACGAQLTKIGEETSEKLQITPPEIYVERTVRPKYACRNCEGTEDEEKATVRIMPVVPSIIPKSIVSASLLCYIMIQKYEDHLPFYRQEKQFKSIGIVISRQDMCNWQQKAYEKLSPLFVLLKEIIKTGPIMQMDETTLQVMGEAGRSDTQKSYMWLALGGPVDKKVALYEYHESRGGHNAKTFLEGYRGYLQTDGYDGYDAAVKDMPEIIHVGCFSHYPRKIIIRGKSRKCRLLQYLA